MKWLTRLRRSFSPAYPALALVSRGERGRCVTKSVTSEHETGPVSEEARPVSAGSGGRIRTYDLWVMRHSAVIPPDHVGDVAAVHRPFLWSLRLTHRIQSYTVP
ncbi:MAG: hypothetical protein QOJ06_294 [Pseudonocardiales bacterium]|nr:hypothetical protein [Pseudonocardiales bacterium]